MPRKYSARLLTAALVLVAAYLFVVLTDMRPSFDAFGWLNWGRQALRWNLNTNSAPSWKPLTFLFTFPYALAGRGQERLWMVTAVAAAFGGSLFAARIAHRLAQPAPRYAAVTAAALAAIGLLGMSRWWGLITISNSDPMDVTLCLAAVDAHLSGRPRLAFAALTLAALGRPEVWPFVAAYAIWLWRAQPSARIGVTAGLAAIPLVWFGIPALTARSWFVAGNVALVPGLALHGDKLTGSVDLYLDLYPFVVWLAVAAALVLAAIKRDKTSLALAGAALAWWAIETAFIFHGWPAQSRYMAESAAVMVVLAAAGAGRLLALGATARLPARLASIAVVVALVVLVIPTASDRVATARADIAQRRFYAKRLAHLQRAIADIGGAHRIRSCGQPVSLRGLQSALAYELGMNTGFVGYKIGKEIHGHKPVVLFEPIDLQWRIRPLNTRKQCADLAYGP
jgi:hypothetical protein